MEYKDKGYTLGLLLRLLEFPRSTFYHKSLGGSPGRPLSTHTLRLNGDLDSDTVVVNHMLKLLGEEFVDYGYRKMTEWLRWHHQYQINPKKVLRLMRQNEITLPSLSRSYGEERRRITEKVPQPAGPYLHMELDIKFIWVQGKGRNALVLNVIDLFHRGWLPYYLGWTIRKEDVIKLLTHIFGNKNLHLQGKIIFIRSDNGSQFIAHEISQAMKYLGLEHEFIHPASPEENAHVESFHSILSRALVRQMEFDSLTHLDEKLAQFHCFYNFKRLHSTTCFRPPLIFLELWKAGWVSEKWDKYNRRKFILSKEGQLRPPLAEHNCFSLNNFNHNNLVLH